MTAIVLSCSRSPYAGVFRGVAPTGKICSTGGIDVSRIEGGKTAEDWEIGQGTSGAGH